MFAGGAEQFNGNGFMPADAPGSSKKGAGLQSSSPSTRRLSVKQLHDATSNGNALVIDDREVANVAIVGKIIDVVKETVTTNLVIDDTTGRITVKIYADGDSLEEERLSELRPGIIVRAFGHLNGSENDRFITAFGARPVTDFNEVTYHLTQIIFQHAHLTKGAPELAGAGAGAAPAGGAAYGAAAPVTNAPAGGFDNGNLTAVQRDVKAFFSATDAMSTEAGLTVADVVNRSAGRYTYAQVREAITFLVDDGQLYSTIDDEHWKACA